MMQNEEWIQSVKRCLEYRRRILDISQKVTALHIAPAFSCLEITDVIYHKLMRNKDESNCVEDIFLMSKGHGCVAQYLVLEQMGILPSKHIEEYCTKNGILGAHPDRGAPGIIASTGSLGHGIGLAVGIAYAEKIKKSKSQVYCVVSDGELQEGSSWEALMMAANLSLTNINVFVDLNDFGGMDRMSQNHKAFYPIDEKFNAFGWECLTVNGHNAAQIYEAALSKKNNRPFVILCKTIKGKGVSFMENVPIWHYRSPNLNEYHEALTELKEVNG